MLNLSKQQLLEIYHKMMKIRLFEKNAIKLFNEGLVRGPMHMYIGEEAVAAGACANLREQDYITSTHRGHGHCIAKGGNIKKMYSELLGKKTGYCKGKGGSMHIADLDIGILGANGIVGGGLGIATGAGLSASMRESDQVTICFFGDGASNQGVFHESLNLAAIWDLPVIYICENNQYGLTGSVSEMVSAPKISDRAKAYDMYGKSIDGNDVVEVYHTVKEAVERAKSGNGPSLIEARTYRWQGHFVGDPCVYRTKEEVEEWKQKCPIERLEKLLKDKYSVKDEKLNIIKNELSVKIEGAVQFAKESDEPEIETLYEDVYA